MLSRSPVNQNERHPVADPARLRHSRRRATVWPGWLGSWRGDLLAVVGLVVVAAAVRWPYLLRFPHMTDETVEMRWALRIWRGEILPLTASDAYYGPLHAYLVAASLWLFGPSIALPRTIVLVIGALTVGVTYLLGKEVGGRWVGLVAGGLLATAPQHIIVNSHVAWQNSTTPFYSTVACWALVRAVRRADWAAGRWGRGGWWLVGAAFAYGLTLQTHVGTIVLAPALVGAVLVAVARRRAWGLVTSRWVVGAVGAAVVAYGPVLLYNLREGLPGVRRVQTRRNYAYVMEPSWEGYRHNLANLFLELARIVSNPLRVPERRLDYLTSPYLLVAVGLAVVGLVLLARRGVWLPLLALGSTALLLPRFNHAYGVEGDRYLLTGRYVTYLLPLATVASGTAVVALVGWARRRVARRWREPVVATSLVLLLLLIVYPLLPLARYYRDESLRDPDNATFLETVRILNAVRGPRTPIWIDRYFEKVNLRDGADALDILDYLLILDGVPHRLVADPAAELLRVIPTLDPNDTEALPIVVMPRDRCWPLRDTIPLQRISGTLILKELYRYYGIYRYAPPPQPARCLPPGG